MNYFSLKSFSFLIFFLPLPQYLILMRVLEGLGGGLTFPAMNVLISRWAPKEERSSISSIVFGGKKDIEIP